MTAVTTELSPRVLDFSAAAGTSNTSDNPISNTANSIASTPPLSDIRLGRSNSKCSPADEQIKHRENGNGSERPNNSQTRGSSSENSLNNSQRRSIEALKAIPKPRQDIVAEGSSENNCSSGIIPDGLLDDNTIYGNEASQALNENGISFIKRNSGDEPNISQAAISGRGRLSLDFPGTSFENGPQLSRKRTWAESTMTGLEDFWNYATTWMGFLVIIYALNVVAWGGMIFLLLCNAAPAMCSPTCEDIESPRRKWIEYDSQILTALFCVTGFGLIPWRFRDLYYLLKYRLGKDEMGLRRLAGIHRDWFRLQGSQNLPPLLGPKNIGANDDYPAASLPYPLLLIPEAPPTGIRAPPTSKWKLDFVVWMFVWNSLFQAVLSGLMWGMNRYNRPSWSVGLFVGLGLVVAAAAGGMAFFERRKVKGKEGVAPREKERERLRNDRELGGGQWNDGSCEIPKEKDKRKTRLI